MFNRASHRKWIVVEIGQSVDTPYLIIIQKVSVVSDLTTDTERIWCPIVVNSLSKIPLFWQIALSSLCLTKSLQWNLHSLIRPLRSRCTSCRTSTAALKVGTSMRRSSLISRHFKSFYVDITLQFNPYFGTLTNFKIKLWKTFLIVRFKSEARKFKLTFPQYSPKSSDQIILSDRLSPLHHSSEKGLSDANDAPI